MVIAPSAMALVSFETTAGIGATMESARTGGMPTLLASMAPIQGNLDDRLARLGKWGAVHRIADRASEASASEASKAGGFRRWSVQWTSIQGILDDRLARLGRWGAVHRIADRASEASASEASREGAPGWLVGWGERGSLS